MTKKEMRRYRRNLNIAWILTFSWLGCGDDPAPVASQRYSDVTDVSVAIGEAGVLEVSNFAGMVDVQPGSRGEVRVIATKWAGRQEDLDQITLEIAEDANGLRVTTTNPAALLNANVDLEITAPPAARPALQTGAGSISYEGRADGECSFATGAGSITLRLPDDLNAEVYLAVGAGPVDIDFPVDGQVSDHVVDGVVGTGADGKIEVHVGAGSIIVRRQ